MLALIRSLDLSPLDQAHTVKIVSAFEAVHGTTLVRLRFKSYEMAVVNYRAALAHALRHNPPGMILHPALIARLLNRDRSTILSALDNCKNVVIRARLIRNQNYARRYQHLLRTMTITAAFLRAVFRDFNQTELDTARVMFWAGSSTEQIAEELAMDTHTASVLLAQVVQPTRLEAMADLLASDYQGSVT